MPAGHMASLMQINEVENMPRRDKVSLSVIRRLPRYYRFLDDLNRSGVSRISSKELSARMGLTASQIRQDLNCFGGFGQQGYGYNVNQLHAEIGSILGTGREFPAILVGAGNIGRAIAMNMDFEQLGFRLTGIFDNSPQIVGSKIKGVTVQNVAELTRFCETENPKVAILTLPRAAAPEIVETLVEHGVTGFWNFSHYDFSIRHPDIVVENVHLSDSLMTLCYMVQDSLQTETAPEKTEP